MPMHGNRTHAKRVCAVPAPLKHTRACRWPMAPGQNVLAGSRPFHKRERAQWLAPFAFARGHGPIL
eukprot:467398-Lingulodinium_polyedra.AAC.1